MTAVEVDMSCAATEEQSGNADEAGKASHTDVETDEALLTGVSRGCSFAPLTYESESWTQTIYDTTKVKIYMLEAKRDSPAFAEDEFYYLSRFLIRQILISANFVPTIADKIAFRVKERLVDEGNTQLTIAQLQTVLFEVMTKEFNYTEKFTKRYKLLSGLMRSRTAIVLFIMGLPGTNTSKIALHLAQRLNIPNTVNTDSVVANVAAFPEAYEPLISFDVGQSEPLSQTSQFEFFGEWKAFSRFVGHRIEADLDKASENGKSVMFEGCGIDPALYVQRGIFKSIRYPNSGCDAERKTNHKSVAGRSYPTIVIPFYLTASKEQLEDGLRGQLAQLVPSSLTSHAEDYVLTFPECRLPRQQQSKFDDIHTYFRQLVNSLLGIQRHCLEYREFIHIVPTDLYQTESTVNSMQEKFLDHLEHAVKDEYPI